MDKNLVIFHFESVSKNILDNNSNLFENFNGLANKSVVYKNYFSSSTSTYMVISDLLYGDEKVFESSNDYSTLICNSKKEKNLFQKLSDEGYYTAVVTAPFLNESEKARYKEIFEDINLYSYATDYDDFKKNIVAILKNEIKYALYITDFISHIGYGGYRGEIKGWNENWEMGYQLIDELLGFVMEQLNDVNKLDDTVVVVYGDHGDDFYTHKFNGGFTHAIEPYASMIHTPFILYNGGESRNVGDLISTIDISDIIEDTLFHRTNNVMRKYSFSRNLYTAQKKERNGLIKSFSVTEGNYLLLANYKGISLYNIKMDPNNNFNLLEFFMMKKGRIKARRNTFLISNSHFDSYRKYNFFDEILVKTEELLNELKRYTNEMYGEIGLKNNEINFSRINHIANAARYRIFINYYNAIIYKIKKLLHFIK